MRIAQLCCGLVAAVLYVLADIGGGLAYAGYSFVDQAVSELFAIGAPTSRAVVLVFSLSSLFLLVFARGLWVSARGHRHVRLLASMFALSALVGLGLWILFPMHMRGADKSFTDTMHLILASNPFVLLTLAAAFLAFRGSFRRYTLATAIVMLVLAVLAFRHAPALEANLQTPGLGLAERASQYIYLLWQAALSVLMLRRESVES